MLDKNVGDALLKLDLSPQTEAPSAQIERIIDIDRRRVPVIRTGAGRAQHQSPDRRRRVLHPARAVRLR